ncbi:MAG: hypothetical protein N3F10_01055 [Candidatus Bathyarchaeota archaeon]|nr:hypothetical protein [Candidatus Bathyarchaeota archaeon]
MVVMEEDPVKLHKEGNTLYELGKYEAAMEKFLKASEQYKKLKNFFDSSYALYKAGECAFAVKDYSKATEYFLKSADLSFEKGFDRFGVSALEYARDCYNALDEKVKAEELQKKINEIKARLEETL